jgi:Cu/Ag efflux protein CusF
MCLALLAQTSAQESKFTYGTVVKVTDKQITIALDETSGQKNAEMVFEIAPDVKLRQMKSIDELDKGSEVEILYRAAKGKLIAKMILLDTEG